MKNKSAIPTILKSIKEKAVVKKEIFKKTQATFDDLKLALRELEKELSVKVKAIDPEIHVEFRDKGRFEAEFKIADDTIVFWMHTDVFTFDTDHSIWKTSYVDEDKARSFCGMITFYNFLSDSFKYKRVNDLGYMIARLFINKDMHYFVEGKRQLGFLYNEFDTAILDHNSLKAVLESAILYCLEFDLYSPPYDDMKQISVSEIIEAEDSHKMSTGKRLGFRFQADDDNIE
jgi:hypothetical protein